MAPYRWHVLTTIIFFLIITFVFFAIASTSRDKVSIETPEQVALSVPTVSFIDPQIGAEKPAVTIVEFADFACESCASLAPTLLQILQKYPNDVRLVWKDFPNESRSAEATPAAVAARCAGELGAFWQFHEQLFTYQLSLSRERYETIASTLNLDAKKFTSCLDGNDTLPKVRKSYQEGLALSITATPTLFINGERYTGSMTYNDLSAIVRSLITNK